MKKILASLLLSGVVFLSGCSLIEKAPKNPAEMQAEIAKESKEKLPQNEEEMFYFLASQNAKAWNVKMKEYMPSKEVLMKNTSKLSVSGTGDLSMLMGQGSADASMTATTKKDISDENNPKVDSVVSFSAKTQKTPLAINFSGEIAMKIVENSLFASLQRFEANVPVPEVAELGNKFIRKWYGNSFAELSELLGTTDLNIQDLFASKSLGVVLYEAMEDYEQNPKKYVTFVKSLPKEDGMHVFEVKYNSEGQKEMFEKVLSSMGLSGDALKEAMKEFGEAMDEFENEIVIIGFSTEDPMLMKIASPSMDLNSGEVIEGKRDIFSFSKDGFSINMYIEKESNVTFGYENGKIFASAKDGKEEINFVEGKYSDAQMDISIINPDTKLEAASIAMKKDEDVWSGTMTPAGLPGMLEVSKISIDQGNFEFAAAVKMTAGEESISLGSIDIVHEISGVDLVSVEKPESFESFENIEKVIQEFEAENAPVPVEDEIDFNEPMFDENEMVIDLDEVVE